MTSLRIHVKKWSFTDFLFSLCSLWTIVEMALGIAEYFKVGWVIPKMMPFAYFVILLAYVGRKEFQRWSERGVGRRRGEVFLFAWWMLLLLMFIGNGTYPGRWSDPWRVLENAFYVLAVFVISDFSKRLHERAERNDVPSNQQAAGSIRRKESHHA